MKRLERAERELAQLGRVEALLGELMRAGRSPVLAIGIVPVAELDQVRVAVFGEAGDAAEPAWDGWMDRAIVTELSLRRPGPRIAFWDADHESAWTVAWTQDEGPLVIWTPRGARLRLQEGTVDVLDQGRWTVLPIERVARVSLGSAGEHQALLRLHTTDGRLVAFAAGRLPAAGLAGAHLGLILGLGP